MYLNVSVYGLYIYMWLSLVQGCFSTSQVWEARMYGQDIERIWIHARCFFLPLSGLGTMDNYINHLDALDLTRVVMAPYGDHCATRRFEQVSVYSGWLRYGDCMVRYLPQRVLRQFGRVQTIPRHPVESAPPNVNLAEITNRFRRALDYALTPHQLGERAVHDVEAEDGYINWFYRHSHPRMVLLNMPVPVPRPPEREVLDARAAQEDGDLGTYNFAE